MEKIIDKKKPQQVFVSNSLMGQTSEPPLNKPWENEESGGPCSAILLRLVWREQDEPGFIRRV